MLRILIIIVATAIILFVAFLGGIKIMQEKKESFAMNEYALDQHWTRAVMPDPEGPENPERVAWLRLLDRLVPLDSPSCIDDDDGDNDNAKNDDDEITRIQDIKKGAALLKWTEPNMLDALQRMMYAVTDGKLRLGPVRVLDKSVISPVSDMKTSWRLWAVMYVPGKAYGRVADVSLTFDASDKSDPFQWKLEIQCLRDVGVLPEIHVVWPISSTDRPVIL